MLMTSEEGQRNLSQWEEQIIMRLAVALGVMVLDDREAGNALDMLQLGKRQFGED